MPLVNFCEKIDKKYQEINKNQFFSEMTNVGNGQFDFIDISDRIMFTTAHFAISLLELWDYMKKDPGDEGYMFSNDDEVARISDKILYLGYDGHSGASFGCVMRSMQFIAIHGYDSFREKYIETNSSSSQRI